VAFVERRSGRVLHKEAIRNQQSWNMSASHELTAGPGNKVRFVHPSREITLNFSDDPWPADAKELDLSVATAGGSGTGGGSSLPAGSAPVPVPEDFREFRPLPRTLPRVVPKEVPKPE
jgi:hypothetical protein